MGCCQSGQKHVTNPNAKTPEKQPQSLKLQTNNNQNSTLKTRMQQNTDIEAKRIDTPPGTDRDRLSAQKDDRLHTSNQQPQQETRPKKVVNQYFDISPKVIKKNKIYHISTTFPVQRPYSNPSEWQKLLAKVQQFQNPISDEELFSKILQLRNRNWIQEQIKLQAEINNPNAGLEGLVTKRRFLQLREQFNWLIWAVAQYYFNGKNDPKAGLPKPNSKAWGQGIEYKGVYIKVLPYEEAYFVLNEMQALKYLQTELLELQALIPYVSAQYQQSKFNTHNDLILPLISGVSCAGFYLYGSPIIYTQDLDQNKEFFNNENTLNQSKIHAVQNSFVQNYDSIQMNAFQHQSNISYSYLHHNLNPDFIQDSYLKFMPMLRHISTRNIIPIIDFQEFNERATEEQKYDLEMKYLTVSVVDIVSKLSDSGGSTLLMKVPCQTNEDISFHHFPRTNYLEVRELKRFIPKDVGKEGDEDFTEPEPTHSLFTKKFFTKHGWDFIMMQRQGANVENTRASSFYTQREIPSKNQTQPEGANKILQLDDYQPGEEGKEIQSKYVSPLKQSILRKNDSMIEDKVNGNVLIAGYNFKKDFRVQYCMASHSYTSNIETLFSVSLDQVSKIIEQSDNVYNSNSLKELMHRKGLNMRFEWIVLAKLRINQYREMVMIDILLRVMRKIINEEIMLKSKVQVHHPQDQTIQDEYYVGNQLDNYKDAIVLYMNALLGRKYQKQKQIFEETIQGLYISRMAVLGILFSLNLKKEEFIYLESKDILDHIVEAPSKNPILFINAVQAYFKVDFKPDFLRICRQDKFLLLSKSQPITVNDIKQVSLKPHVYFSIREHAYFILARQITYYSKDGKMQHVSKIKTKTQKDLMKQSFSRPRHDNDSFVSTTSLRHQYGIGPQGIVNEQSTFGDDQSKTLRNQGHLESDKVSQTTNRQFKHITEAQDLYHSSQKKQIHQGLQTPKKHDIIDLSKLQRRAAFKPTSVQEIIMPSVLYKLKTFISSSPLHCFDDQTKTYVGENLTVLQAYYEMPNIDIVNEWVICIESQLKDVISVTGGEQVLMEALIYQAILTYFFENDQDSLFKILTKMRDVLVLAYSCAPEIIVTTQILTGIFFEDQKDKMPIIETEKSYLTGLMSIFLLYGDPRGRGNIGIPYTLYLSWKLSLLALCEDKKLHDSEFAEEIFDANLKSLYNHKKLYKEQQVIACQIQNREQVTNTAIYTPFEQKLEEKELNRQMFDMKKYSRRHHQPVTVASGLGKNPPKQLAHRPTMIGTKNTSNYATHQANQLEIQKQHFDVNSKQKFEEFKSRSQVSQGANKKDREFDVDIDEIDLEINDEKKNIYAEQNFKNNEWYIGTCPFQHWSIYRQQINQIMQAHPQAIKNHSQAIQYQKQIYKDMLSKALPKDSFYQWMIKFNPIMYSCGIQWSNQMLKEIVFNQNQQMVSSSGSSVVMSNHGLSHQSLSSLTSTGKERRNIHLGSYSQILGKEAGGVSKNDMSGVVFTWGSDSYGQLGLDVLTPSLAQTNINLKVLYPRMVVSLRDEIIKEICCGHSHTLVINIHGQVYGWGMNESKQLGLGKDSPEILRKPVMNPYLSNIVKVSAGNEHSLAISKNGELFTWGAGGLTGHGDVETRAIPTKLDFFSKTKVHLAVCGGLHTIAINKDGQAYSWGSTEGGQLGLPLEMIASIVQGKDIPVISPQKIPKLQGKFIVQIASGEAHTIVMTKDCELFGWGMSNYGQLGLGFSSDSFEPGIGMEKSKVHEPEEIIHLKNENIQKIYCGATFSLFQTEQGDLYGCGMNDLGQLGLDTFMDEMNTLQKAKRGKHQQTSDVTLPTRVICFQGIPLINVACGENHALGVSGEKNMLWAWGMYKNGQLGLGEVNQKMNPRPVQTLCSSTIQKIACGSMHSQALIGDSNSVSTYTSQYYSWSENPNNQWHSDIRALSYKEDLAQSFMLEEEVPDDQGGRIKSPK